MGFPTASRDVLSWESSCFKCLNVTVSAIFNDNKCIKTVSPASNYGKNRALRVKRPQRYSFFLIQPIILRFDMFLSCREYAVMSIVPYFFVDAIRGQASSPVLLLSEPKFAVF